MKIKQKEARIGANFCKNKVLGLRPDLNQKCTPEVK